MIDLPPVAPVPFAVPPWMDEISRRHESGSNVAFGLVGNVRDHVAKTDAMNLERYLSLSLGKVDIPIVVVYSPDQGVRFADEIVGRIPKIQFDYTRELPAEVGTMRRLFKQFFVPRPPSDESSRMASLLRQAQGAAVDQDNLPSSPGEVIPLLGSMLAGRAVNPSPTARPPARCAVVIENAHAVAPQGDLGTKSPGERAVILSLARWATDPEILDRQGLVLLISETSSDVHASLRTASSRYHWLRIDLPSESERRSYWAFMVPQNKIAFAPDYDLDQLAAQTAGLSKVHCEGIARESIFFSGQVLSRDLVKERKARIIRQEYEDQIEELESDVDLDGLGGMPEIKDFLRRRVIRPIREGKRHLAPMGMIFLGPPGCGKTFTAAALAKESGFNALKFALDKILDKYVGESEKKLERLFGAFRAMAPCFVFVDEIDQKMQRGDGSSSPVFSSIFGRMLEFISTPSNRGNIIFVAATNQPLLLDPALLRAGRLEIKIPFLPPGEKDRRDLFALLTGGAFRIADDLIARTEGWTQSEIASLVREARVYAELEGMRFGDTALAMTVGSIPGRRIDYSAYIEQAIAFTEDLRLLPEEYRKRIREAEDRRLDAVARRLNFREEV